MHPILFEPFGFAIYTYSLALLVAFIASVALCVWIAKRRGPTNAEYIQEMSLLGIIWGLVGGRVGWVLWDFDYYLANPGQILNLRAGGMTILGGILLPAIALFIYFKIKGIQPLNVLDTMAAPLLLGMAIGRIGCVLNGCCYGEVCPIDFPFALHYPEGLFGAGVPSGPRYPSQLFEATADLFLMGLVIWFLPRIKFAGQALYVTLSGYGIIRFLNEFTRDDIKFVGPLTIGQWVGLGMLVFGILGFLGAYGKPEVDTSWQTGPENQRPDKKR